MKDRMRLISSVRRACSSCLYRKRKCDWHIQAKNHTRSLAHSHTDSEATVCLVTITQTVKQDAVCRDISHTLKSVALSLWIT